METENDRVEHPKHYNNSAIGIECIEISRHLDFNLGNAFKYIYRHGKKSEQGITDLGKAIEDLKKAEWYLKDEINMLESQLEVYNKNK